MVLWGALFIAAPVTLVWGASWLVETLTCTIANSCR